MTRRLYEEDPFLFDFISPLRSRAARGSGEEVVLERTAFFATSGGQSHDTGDLGGARVIDVFARGDDIVHATDAPLPGAPEAGAEIRGRVDVARRLDHMRQHHGQHLLSAAFVRTAKLETTSVHFGAETSTLDLSGAASEAQIAAAVDAANAIVLEDREVRVHRVARGEIAKFALRREPGTEAEVLRVIEVADFDATPCSGTHPLRTGQVGPIAVIGAEKAKGHTRLTFVCGERALADARTKDAALRAMAREFSVAPDAVAAAVAKLRASERELRRRVRAADEALAEHEARERVAACEGSVVAAALGAERSEEGIVALAAKIAALGKCAVVGAASGERAFLVVSSPDKSRDAAAALKAALPSIEGKGGGNVALARGSGTRAAGLQVAIDTAARILGSTTAER